LKRIFQVLASLFQSLALGVNPRNFFHPSSPPITRLLVRSGQFHVCIFLAFGPLVHSLGAREIVQKPLDELVIYNLPIAFKSGNTTVLFPSAISGLYAKSVAVQEQPNADFLISFTPGNYYFTVRALNSEAKDHLTVIYNRKAYVLRLSASDKPLYTVTFFQEATARGSARSVVPERLLSLMDKAKAYPLLEKDYPDALAGVLHASPNATNYYDKFRLLIRDVWRFEQEDTLVFRIELENNSDRAVCYKPQDLAVPVDFEDRAALEARPRLEAVEILHDLAAVEEMAVRQQIAVESRSVGQAPGVRDLPVHVQEVHGAVAVHRREQGVARLGPNRIVGDEPCPAPSDLLLIHHAHVRRLRGAPILRNLYLIRSASSRQASDSAGPTLWHTRCSLEGWRSAENARPADVNEFPDETRREQ